MSDLDEIKFLTYSDLPTIRINGERQLKFESKELRDTWLVFFRQHHRGHCVKLDQENHTILININHVMIITENYEKKNSKTYFINEKLFFTGLSTDKESLINNSDKKYQKITHQDQTWWINKKLKTELIGTNIILTNADNETFTLRF